MDTEIFLDRCEEIQGENSELAVLADDLYESLEEGSDGPEREELVRRAKEKIRLWEALWEDLEDEELKEEVQPIYRYIDSLKEDLMAMGCDA